MKTISPLFSGVAVLAALLALSSPLVFAEEIMAPPHPQVHVTVPVQEIQPNERLAMPQPIRLAVYAGDELILDTGLGDRSPAVTVSWKKDGRDLSSAGTSLTIPYTTALDSGVYTVVLPPEFVAPRITVDVVRPGHIGNFSTRAEVDGHKPLIAGYTVTGTSAKAVLVRAVGPSLAAFGIRNPVTDPEFRLFDSEGREITFAHIQVVMPSGYWPEIFKSAGAFPLGDGEKAYQSYDLLTLAPGSYTAHAFDRSGHGGAVLLEFYEIPEYTGIVF